MVPDFPPPSHLVVMPEESGMKLLRFLERRLLEPATKSLLHKWIRTGQVRVNGGRAKPFTLLAAADQVRIPPFAQPRRLDPPLPRSKETRAAPAGLREILGPDLPVLARTADLLALSKPPGLACQPGSGLGDSVSGRLASVFAGNPFVPAPAHRLDRHTSGVLLAAMNHAAQKALHSLFGTGGIRKHYLAWVAGDWPGTGPCLMADRLEIRRDAQGREGVAALPGGLLLEPPFENIPDGVTEWKGSALCLVRPWGTIPGSALGLEEFPSLSGLLLCLLTGRKHQIRAQLASRRFPIIGDGRYGGPPFSGMLLHAYLLSLPEILTDAGSPRQAFSVLPDWPPPCMPDPQCLAAAMRELEHMADALPGLHRPL